jgi:hypothetical protein
LTYEDAEKDDDNNMATTNVPVAMSGGVVGTGGVVTGGMVVTGGVVVPETVQPPPDGCKRVELWAGSQ